jgi:single-strand DNA-binding protein
MPVAHFDLAVNKVWFDEGGERHEKTTWIRITTWRRQAEVCAAHLTKGRRVLVKGELEPASAFVDREGNARASNEVTAHRVVFLGGANGQEGADSDADATASLSELPQF